MKKPRLPHFVAGLLAASTASAAINIDTVLVDDAGNTNDSTGYGGVDYDYYIGTYEVTNTQYTAFLNATAATDTHGLYDSNMSSDTQGGISQSGTSGSFSYSVKNGFENKPVNFVSFWDAARFANWLTTGDTETGVYNLNGTTNPINDTITRDTTAWNNGGVAIASENEWYKAAYYDPTLNSGSGGYWLYPTQSNTLPTYEHPPGNTNSANYNCAVSAVTDVGAYTNSTSHYGTFDQGGNVWDLNDTIVTAGSRGMRGSNFGCFGPPPGSSYRSYIDAASESGGLGFRVSSLEPIIIPPEPTPLTATIGKVVGGVGIGFNSVTGKTYQVQYKLKLEDPTWIDVGEEIVGDGTTKTHYDDIDNPTGFYRVTEL